MNEKDLIDLGVAEDVAKKIIVLHGKDIEAKKNELTTATTEATALKNQLSEANKQIEDFKKLDVDGVKKAADDWKTKYEQTVEQHATESKQRQFDTALEKGLAEAKAKNPKALKGLLDLANLKYNEADGSLIGLKEQLEKIKPENDYLFEPAENAEKTPEIVAHTDGKSTNYDAVVAGALKGAGITLPQGK